MCRSSSGSTVVAVPAAMARGVRNVRRKDRSTKDAGEIRDQCVSAVYCQLDLDADIEHRHRHTTVAAE
jgi:hypothetical protein